MKIKILKFIYLHLIYLSLYLLIFLACWHGRFFPACADKTDKSAPTCADKPINRHRSMLVSYWFTGLSIYQVIGLLVYIFVYRFIGLLGCWCIGLLIYWVINIYNKNLLILLFFYNIYNF